MPLRLPGPDAPGVVLLALEDEERLTEATEWLEGADYLVLATADPDQARAWIAARHDADVLVVDHTLCLGASSLLQAAQEAPAGLSVLMVGDADVFLITQAMAVGASAFLQLPLTELTLLSFVALALRDAREAQRRERYALALTAPPVSFAGVVGTSPRMQEVMETLRKAAPTDAPVVILGETGTGKELLARAIHDSSARAKGPFVALHLLATPAGLLESELFGHRKGAFTGATTDRTGKLELADGGTLFLDELGDIPLDTQAKLLRVLETKSFEPVGGNRTISSDFRLVAATNQDVEQLIREKKFREELWMRLNVIRIDLPPLRARRQDVPLLAERFVQDTASRYRKRVEGIEPDALTALARYPFPHGNIRELRNLVERMVILCDGPRITRADLPREVLGEQASEGAEAGEGEAALAGRSMEEIEREAIRQTLAMVDGNRKQAANLLQIGERTLYRKIEKFGL
ncbi:MAG: sigma 54-interacting transcriptional regulator [Planctomycetota bacterium]